MSENGTKENLDERSQINIVLDALRVAESEGVELDRAGLIRASGLTKGQVDDALSRLRAKGAIDDKPKSYKIVPEYRPPRTPTFSYFADGGCKLEMGDACLMLTPAEFLAVAQGCAGKLAMSLINTSILPVAIEVREMGTEVNRIKESVSRRKP